MNNRGITVIELLLVIALVALLGATTIPVGSSFLTRMYLGNKTNEVASTLRTARLNSMIGKEDSQWGVIVSGRQIILFKGSSYAERDMDFDETYRIPTSISISQSEIVFSKLHGRPDSSESFSISASTGDTSTISVDGEGVVDVN